MNVRNEPVHEIFCVVKHEPHRTEEETLWVSTCKKYISFGNKFDCVEGVTGVESLSPRRFWWGLTHDFQGCEFPWFPGILPGMVTGIIVFQYFPFPSTSHSDPSGGGTGQLPSIPIHDFFAQNKHFSPKDPLVFTDSLVSCQTMRGGKRGWRTCGPRWWWDIKRWTKLRRVVQWQRALFYSRSHLLQTWSCVENILHQKRSGLRSLQIYSKNGYNLQGVHWGITFGELLRAH